MRTQKLLLLLLFLMGFCASSTQKTGNLILNDNRLNGKECIVSLDCAQPTPAEGTTIIVKHLGVNSTTGMLSNPIYWRLKDHNESIQQVATTSFISSCKLKVINSLLGA